ncbi:ATP-binding protein [Klebsiella sp. Ap-873]|nr:ATP-binding protein [Klebsiella sp. Ap-873]
MLNVNQMREKSELKSRQEQLTEELKFATDGIKPFHYDRWQESREAATCAMHGEYSSHVLTGPEFRGVPGVKRSGCPECIRHELAGTESSLRSLQVEELLNDAGIARRFDSSEFENYLPVNQEAAKNLSDCQRYADNWSNILAAGTGLVMTGSCGTGKNHLAVSMVKDIIRNHLARVEITDVMRLTRAVKSTWRNNSSHTEDEVIGHYASLDLLIIDEVGVQFGSQSESVILQEIINARYESVLPTILISNLTYDQLSDAIGERAVDRITNGGRNRLAFNWESYRSKTGSKAE